MYALPGGCPFSVIYDQTPKHLLDPPYKLFDKLAVPLYPMAEHRKISLRHILKSMGAKLMRAPRRKPTRSSLDASTQQEALVTEHNRDSTSREEHLAPQGSLPGMSRAAGSRKQTTEAEAGGDCKDRENPDSAGQTEMPGPSTEDADAQFTGSSVTSSSASQSQQITEAMSALDIPELAAVDSEPEFWRHSTSLGQLAAQQTIDIESPAASLTDVSVGIRAVSAAKTELDADSRAGPPLAAPRALQNLQNAGALWDQAEAPKDGGNGVLGSFRRVVSRSLGISSPKAEATRTSSHPGHRRDDWQAASLAGEQGDSGNSFFQSESRRTFVRHRKASLIEQKYASLVP